MPSDAFETVLGYHRRTKHRPDGYARSPGFLDWANQPEPFRFYSGRPPIRLPLLAADPWPPPAAAVPFDVAAIGGLLELSLGLSAWKAAGAARWALRINPSSGNLHPTEAHLVVPPQAIAGAGLCHYNALGHMLEPRAAVDAALWRRIADHLGGPGLLVGLTSIFWREAWKYGERAWRYCQLDIGHALSALSVAAGFFAWQITMLEWLSDDAVARVLGLDRTTWAPGDAEHPEILCWVHPAGRMPAALDLPPDILEAFGRLDLCATPNRLSPSHVDWDIITTVAAAVRRPQGTRDGHCPPTDCFPAGKPRHQMCDGPPPEPPPAAVTPALVRRRRSGQAYDATATVPRETLARILSATYTGADRPALDGLAAPPPVGLALFVHRVDGLIPGLYWYDRHPPMADAVARASQEPLEWHPEPLIAGLFRLVAGDRASEARRLACHQDIAADGICCLAMVAEFEDGLKAAPHRYRELFWRCGQIGQALYLAAEAEGLSGTGIGCFFDNEVHRCLGLADPRYQCLYQFTVGRAVRDRRLATHPPYRHLESI